MLDLTDPQSWNAYSYVNNNPLINPATNRIDSAVSGQSNYSYDGAGDLTHDATGHGFAYDAENKQATFDDGASTLRPS